MAPPSASRRSVGVRTGSTSGAQIVGLKELRKELKKLEDGKAFSRELGRGLRMVAKKAAGHAQAEARSLGGAQRHFAGAIRGRGGATGARLVIADDTANAAFWGAKQKWTGWNARNSGKGPANQPDWIGNTWQVAERGQGPIALNDSLATHMPEYVEDIYQVLEDVTRGAFPN